MFHLDSWKEQLIKTKSNLIGFHWLTGLKAWDLLLIREDGFDLYKVDPRDIKAKRVKDFSEQIGHYWVQSDPCTLVIAESPPRLGTMQVYFLTSEKVIKGCKLLIDVSPSITNQWTSTPFSSRDLYSADGLEAAPHEVRLSRIYDQTQLVHLHCLKGFASVFTIESTEARTVSELFRVSPGAFDISICDNVLLLHNITDQSTFVYDTKAQNKQLPCCLVWHGVSKSPVSVTFRVYIDRNQTDYFPELQIKYNGKVIPNLRDFRGALDVCKTENLVECPWKIPNRHTKVSEDVYVDLENCSYSRVALNLKEMAENWGNAEDCVRFLMRRTVISREEIVTFGLKRIENRLNIREMEGLFAALLTENSKEMSQTDLHTLLFRRLFLCPSLDSVYITASLFCFFQVAAAHNLPVSSNIQFAVAQFLHRSGQLALLLQTLMYGVMEDSQELAVMLTISDRTAVHVEGLDMMYRLGLVEDLGQQLYERKRYIELLNFLDREAAFPPSQQFIAALITSSPDSSLTDSLQALLFPKKTTSFAANST